MGLEAAKTAVDKLVNSLGRILPAKEDIRERVLIYDLHTTCDSPFRFVVNVRANANGVLQFIKLFAEDAPEGYADGLHPELSTDFRSVREARSLLAQIAASKATRSKNSEANAGARSIVSKGDAFGSDSDPCAPGLSKAERLRRLSGFGSVRQTAQGTFTAGPHEVMFSLDTTTLISCQ